jgi:phenylalanyl-tRNA synthetase beta chain
MPVVTIRKGYLLKLIGSKMTDKAIEGEIAKLGLNVESIDENEISIEVASNRPDLLSAVGIARAVRYFTHRSNKYDYEIDESVPATSIAVGKKVGGVRPYIAGLVVRDLKFTDDSLAELLSFEDKFCETYGRNRRKIAIGMHDLSKVDLNSLSYDIVSDMQFVPLNGTKETYFSKVLQANEKGKKYSSTILEGKKGYPVLFDSRGVLALIPIINSDRTKVLVSTTSVLIDITSTSEYLAKRTADLLAALFMDMGAEVRKVRIEYERASWTTPELVKTKIRMPISRAEETIGVKVGPNNSAILASKMGYLSSFIGTKLDVVVPPYRLDVIDEQDVIEDIAIAYGYEYIRPIPVKASQAGALEELTTIRQKLEEAMLGLGFSQMMNSYLSNEETNFTKMRLYNDGNYIKIRSAKAASITMLRTWVLPSLMKNGGMSQSEKMPQKMFELDMSFGITDRTIRESYNLATLSIDPKTNFNYIKSVLEAIAESFNFQFKTESFEHGAFISGRCSKIIVNGNVVGFFGEVHPEVLDNFGIEEPAVAFEMDVSFLVKK